MENLTDKQLRTKEYEDIERNLNQKIMQVTIEIKDHYPELTKFLEEMPVTVSDETDVEITLRNLESYYKLLNSILNDYISEQS